MIGRKKSEKEVEEKEPIIYIEPKPDYELVEEYWVIEPYAKVKIMSMPELGGQLAYFVDEVKLNDKEQKAKEKLVDILSIEMKPPETFEVDVRKYIIEEARRLARKYRKIVRGLSEESWNKVIYYVERDLLGYGPINVLMEDWNLEDISCDGVNRAIHVWHRKYESIPTNIVFTDRNYLREFIIKLAHLGGKHVSAAFPIVDTMLPGRHRLAATFGEEVSPRGSTFTIRKFREKPFSIIELIDSGNIDTWTAAYLWLMLEHRMTLMIIGGTAAGKTTFLNAVALFIKPGMKIVTIEETAELNLPHENWVQLISRESYGLGESKLGEISLYDLVKVSLRYRPDYIIVGEIRGAEAFVLFQAMASVSSDTPILIRKGGEVKLVKIGDFIDSFYPEGVERIPIPVSGVEVLTIDGGKACFKPIRYVLRHRADEIYRIKYVGGEVRATESHSVFVMDSDTLKIRTKAVKDLKKGDLLISFVKKNWAESYPTVNMVDLLPQHDRILVDNIPKEVKTVIGIKRNPIPLTYLKNKISLKALKDAYLKLPKGKTIPMYLRFDEDLAYLLGVYLADGCVKLNNRGGKVVFSLGKGEKDVFDRIVRIFGEKFNDTPYIEDRGSYVIVEYNNKLLAYLFKSLCGGRNAEKHVPSKLWTSPQSVIKTFFDGLRADARRSTKRPHQLTIVQKNKHLIQELAWLARLAGFNVRVRREGEYYSITIDYKKSRKPFLGNGVPIDALRRLYANLKPKNMPLKYTYILLNNKRRQKFVRKDIALKVLKWILNNRTREPTEEDRRIIDRIHNLIDEEIVLLPIVDIVREQYRGYVYDVSVPESEAFLGGENPILLHNTGHGGLTTFHADSLENAIRRLMSPPMNISEPYIPMLNMVVYVARTVLPKGGFGRRLMALWEIEDYEKYRQLIKWDPRSDKHVIVGDSYLINLLADRTGRTREQILEEIARRQTVLLWLWQRRIIEMKDVATYIASYYNFPDQMYERALKELKEMGVDVDKYIIRKLVPITRFEPVSTKMTIYDKVMQIYSRYGEKEEKSPLQFISVRQEPVRLSEPLEVTKIPKPQEELTENERKILHLISYYGGEIDHRTVMQESGLPRDTFWRTITSLTGKGLIISSLVYVNGRPMIGFKLTKKAGEFLKS